jgi:hypothetical protein
MPGLFRKIVRVPVRDTVTGIDYPSKAAAGRALAASFGYNPEYKLVWFYIHYRVPQRFVDPNTGVIIPLEKTR